MDNYGKETPFAPNTHTVGKGTNLELHDTLYMYSLSFVGSGLTLSPAALTWVAVDLSLALLVIVVLVIACFAWKSYSRKLIKERKVCSKHDPTSVLVVILRTESLIHVV